MDVSACLRKQLHPKEKGDNMKNNIWKIIIIILVLAAVIAGARALYLHLSDRVDADNVVEFNTLGTVTAGETAEDSLRSAPDFTLYDDDGNAHQLSEFFGKPVVINFWASWCPPCRNEMPVFDEAFSEYGDEVNFLMVNLTDGSRETRDSARSFIEDQGYSFPVYYDLDGQGSSEYQLYYIPDTYFINSDGQIISFAQGSISEEDFNKQLADLLGK